MHCCGHAATAATQRTSFCQMVAAQEEALIEHASGKTLCKAKLDQENNGTLEQSLPTTHHFFGDKLFTVHTQS